MIATRTRRALGALVLLLALVLGLAAPIAAQEGADLDDITARLVSQSSFVREGETFTMTVDIEGATPTDQIKVDIWGREFGPADRREIREVTGGVDPTSLDLNNLKKYPYVVGSVVDASTGLATITIPQDAVNDLPGVYPLTVFVQRGGVANRTEILFTTTLVRSGPVGEGGALDVAFVLPVAAPVAHQPDGTVDVEDGDRTRLQSLADLFSGTLATLPLTVEPRGETLDALRGSGDPADATLARSIAAMAAGRDVRTGSYVAVDEEALRRRGLDVLVAQLATAGTAAAQRNGIAVPVTSATIARLGPTDTPDTLALRGFDAEYFVVADSALEPLDPERFPATLLQSFTLEDARGEATRAVSSDDYLLGLASALDDPNLADKRPLYLQRFLADLVAGYGDEPESVRGAVIVLPEDLDVSDPAIGTLFTTLTTVPELHLTTLDALVDNISGATPLGGGRSEVGDAEPLVRRLEPEPAQDLGTYPARATAVDSELRGFESIAGQSEATSDLERLRLIAAAEQFGDARREAYLSAVERGIDAGLLAPDGGPGLVGPGSQRVTMTSRRAKIPIQIENRLAYPAHVRIELESEKLDFPEGWLRETTLAPGPNTIEVEVEAKTSGDSLLEVTILPPAGAPELGTLASGSFTVRSTALSGLGLFISIVALAVLLVWWARHVRRTRRARNQKPTDRAAIVLPADEPADATAADATATEDAPAPPVADTAEPVADTAPTPSLTRTET